MGKKLAIPGHPTRGREVIELLEMLGGDNIYSHWYGDQENMRYFINEQGNIDNGYLMANCDNYEVFTLEEFWEKYPFKVGDKVVYEDDNDIVVINEIKWDNTVGDIFYNVKRIDENDCFLCPPELLKPYKETNMNENKFPTFEPIFKMNDELEYKIPDGYEITEVSKDKVFIKPIKFKYPKTYAECCMIMRVELWNTLWGEDATEYERQTEHLINTFIKLKVCRDAYWKIAGEQMGLDKPWEPKYEVLMDNTFFTIQTFNGEIDKSATSHRNSILAFPTIEMRDTFYENFKDLIEQCKELL